MALKLVRNSNITNYLKISRRFVTTIVTGNESCSEPQSRGLVLGVYSNEDDKLDQGALTPAAWKYNKESTGGRLLDLLRIAGPMPKRGEARIFYNLEPTYSAVAVCGLGKECLGYDSHEQIDEGKEAIRIAAAIGCKELQKLETNKIFVESFDNAESAAEGALMSVWVYQELKNKLNQKYIPQLELHREIDTDCDWDGWKIGLQKAAAQNLARQLQETPANLMTPTMFAQSVVEVLCKSGVNVEVKVRNWAESQQMNAFLAVAKGSCEPPIFLELSYYGSTAKDRPIVLIGQGNTFDSGGTCAKKIDSLKNMRGDMSGAAIVVAACRAIASLQLPVNIRGLIPLCENMIGCNAIKPGDVVTAMNGKSIEVENTDYEGALVLVDALLYSQNFFPKCIIDVGTVSDEMEESLGKATCGIFTNSEELWKNMKNASIHTGDRVWRMPLWDFFTKQMISSNAVDVQNVGIGRGGEACKAAAFLKEFVPCGKWMHLVRIIFNQLFSCNLCFFFSRTLMEL